MICVIITLNAIDYELARDRYDLTLPAASSLFMFSLTVSGLAAGCTFRPTSAAPCYNSIYRMLDDNLLSDRRLETFQSPATYHSKTLLHNHWNELEYVLPACYGKLHSEPKVEFSITFFRMQKDRRKSESWLHGVRRDDLGIAVTSLRYLSTHRP